MSRLETLSGLVARPTPPSDLADADPAVVTNFAERSLLEGVRVGLCLALGRELGDAVFADLVGTADKPNTSLAPHASRAVTSKWACRCRRNLGLAVRTPANGVGRGKKGGAAK